METRLVEQLFSDFEALANTTENGVEFWLAREIQYLLGYTKWSNFVGVVLKAQESINTAGSQASDHIAGTSKMVKLGSGAQREIDDYMLTRYACYLIAQNGNSSKPEIAFAQSYFAIQSRKLELIEQKMADIERLTARKKLTITEKELSKVIFEQTKSDKNFGLIRSKGDTALFGMPTKDMKQRREVKENKPLADFMPTILLKAKDFATEITIYNAQQKNMTTEVSISDEHITNNSIVRETLVKRGIVPEDLPPSPDIKTIEKSINSDQKVLAKEPKKLSSDQNLLSMQQILDESGIQESKKPIRELENISGNIDEILYGKDSE